MADDNYQPNALFNMSIGLNPDGTAKREPEPDTEAASMWKGLTPTMRLDLRLVVDLANAGAAAVGLGKKQTAPLLRRGLIRQFQTESGARGNAPTDLGLRVADHGARNPG